MSEEETVAIPAEQYERCERRIVGTAFESVDQYVQFVVSEVLDPAAGGADEADDDRGPAEDRLEALGYLDG